MFKEGFRKVKGKYDYFYNPYFREKNLDADNFQAEITNPLAYKSTKVFRERRRYVLKAVKKATAPGHIETYSSAKMRLKLKEFDDLHPQSNQSG
jgi:hypothetical protein